MILKNTDVGRFCELMKNRGIVCFGVNIQMLEGFFKCCSLVNNIKYLVDNDKNKWNTKYKIFGIERDIISPDQLPSFLSKDDIVLITTMSWNAGRAIMDQLNSILDLDDKELFFAKLMLREMKSFKYWNPEKIPSNLRRSEEQLIPKIIHYCWFGNASIPEEHQKYIEGWKKICPDYKIICWNEKNYDIEKNAYMKQAYEKKIWGFVPDYIRKDVLYQYGGIYLDTDVEMIKRPDELLYQDGFCGIETNNKFNTKVNFGLGYGARKGLPILRELRDVYEGENFHYTLDTYIKTGPDYETEVLQKHGLQLNNKYQVIEDMTVYPLEVLSGNRNNTSESFITENTYFVHHYASSWNNEKYKSDKRNLRELYQMFQKI